MSHIAGLFLAMLVSAIGSTASAQTSVPHPLRPAASPPPAFQPPATPEAAPAPAPESPPTRAKRPRSPAQLANDERLRACGKEWRTRKEALKAQGLTWYRFSAECRKRLKGVRI